MITTWDLVGECLHVPGRIRGLLWLQQISSGESGRKLVQEGIGGMQIIYVCVGF